MAEIHIEMSLSYTSVCHCHTICPRNGNPISVVLAPADSRCKCIVPTCIWTDVPHVAVLVLDNQSIVGNFPVHKAPPDSSVVELQLSVWPEARAVVRLFDFEVFVHL